MGTCTCGRTAVSVRISECWHVYSHAHIFCVGKTRKKEHVSLLSRYVGVKSVDSLPRTQWCTREYQSAQTLSSQLTSVSTRIYTCTCINMYMFICSFQHSISMGRRLCLCLLVYDEAIHICVTLCFHAYLLLCQRRFTCTQVRLLGRDICISESYTLRNYW